MPSITSWTRLETDTRDPDMRTTVAARVFDPAWMLARQWQVGEFQAENTGSPVAARVRANFAMLTRCRLGELPPGTYTAPAYDPHAMPLEVMVERRPMRASDPDDQRMVRFAIEAGLHFLRMLERQPLSKSYRRAFCARFALQPTPAEPGHPHDQATARFEAAMGGRAPDGRRLEEAIKSGGAASVSTDPQLAVAPADQAEVQQTAERWLAWYESVFSEPPAAATNPWIPSRMEYALTVASPPFDLTAVEYDGGNIDWSSFDVNLQVNTEPAAPSTTIVDTTVPAPVTFRGAPAARFWELEDARIEYGLMQVGPTDLAQLLMIEYASSYGNDWFVIPLNLPVGSLTTIDSLVVTDTFGVRSLLRQIGHPALPRPHWSMWELAYTRESALPGPQRALFFLPPSLPRTVEGGAVEEVLFMRDEMANMAWAIERRIESPIEMPIPRHQDPSTDTGQPGGQPVASAADVPPRYLLASSVPAHWIPLLPVQLSVAPGRIESRLRRGAVLQPDGSTTVHRAQGEMLNSAPELLLYDEEIPREGIRMERHRQMTRWVDGSTWAWTAYRKQVGRGEGSSGLRFDGLEPE